MSLQNLDEFHPFPIKLCYEPPSLYLEWKIVNPVTHILTNSATKGSIFFTQVPEKACAILFKKSSTRQTSEASPSCIVSCDSGEVYVVLLGKSGESVKICQTQGSIVWANFVQDYLLVLESCGKLFVGTLNTSNQTAKDVLNWKSVTLPLTPVTCSAVDDYLVLSDGYNSYAYELQLSQTELHDTILSLPFCGIIRIEKKGPGSIILISCDGMPYSISRLQLQEIVRKCKSTLPRNDSNTLYIHNLNLAGVMKSIKRFSDVAKQENMGLEKVNLYLEQISMAQHFLSEPQKDFFDVRLSVSCSGLEGYILTINLTPLLPLAKLQGPWWQLNVKLKDCDYLNCAYSSLIDGVSQSVIVDLRIPSSYVEDLVLYPDREAYVEIDLIFSHFTLNKPLCTFKAGETPVDIVYFMTSIKNVSLPSVFSRSFVDNIAQAFPDLKRATTSKTKPVINQSPQTVFILLRKKNRPVLECLLAKTPSTESESISVTRWLQNISLGITCDLTKENFFKLTLESLSRPLIIAVKSAIERKAIKNCSVKCEGKVKLPSSLYKQAHMTKVILDLESSSQNLSEEPLKRVYDSVCNLLSSVVL